MKDAEGRTLCFTIPRLGRGKSVADFIETDAVPAFEGDSAWFEIIKVSAVPWPRWTVVRKVEGDTAR